MATPNTLKCKIFCVFISISISTMTHPFQLLSCCANREEERISKPRLNNGKFASHFQNFISSLSYMTLSIGKVHQTYHLHEVHQENA